MPPKKVNVPVAETKKEERVTRSSLRSKGKDAEDVEPIKSKPKDEDDPQPKKKKQQNTKGKKAESKEGKEGKDKKEDEDTSPKTAKKGTSTQKQQEQNPTTTAQPNEAQQQQKQLKKLVLKGSIPVDQYFSKSSHFKIYTDDNKIYAATLNQSNIEANNNKFYIIQLLQNEQNVLEFMLFTRWGRVGVQGQSSQQAYKNKDVAIKEYNKKLNEKIRKSYRLVEMNYEENAEEEKVEKKEGQEQPTSTLDPQVQELIKLIFDMKMMAKQMKEIGYDANKMPLGKLAKSSILKGYEILKEIMNEIKGSNKEGVVRQLSGSFYSEIPHNFGFQNMLNFVLDSQKKVKEKLEMLQSLEDIQVFTKLLDEGSGDSDMNELDSNYLKLNMKIAPLDKASKTYEILLEYVKNTHASSHSAYRLEVQDIFELQKEVELERYKKDISNKQLLWHGSRLTNFVGILSQGLRIAPPEAPVTGYMFGKGVYFADMVTKSANYCFTSRENNIGLMLLCEVALGETNEKFYADYYANLLPEGKHSTKGCGKTAPKDGKMLDNVLIPCGQGTSTGISQCSLLYNEFIVYDIAQIKCRYLFRMKFNYT